MIKVNLKYPNGATYESETATVAELITLLESVSSDMPLFLQDGDQGKVPVRLLGETVSPDLSTGFAFLIEPVVKLD